MDRLFGGGRSILLILVALAVLLPGAALAQSPNDERPTIAQQELLNQLGDQDARVYRSDTTGNVNLIGSTTKQDAIERPSGLPANASPEAAARAHLSKYGALFGLRDQAQQLRAEGAEEASQGRSVVHFQQLHSGVPVLGGELNVQLTETNELLVANGEVLSGAAVDSASRRSTATATRPTT
jgi:bacillolysin